MGGIIRPKVAYCLKTPKTFSFISFNFISNEELSWRPGGIAIRYQRHLFLSLCCGNSSWYIRLSAAKSLVLSFLLSGVPRAPFWRLCFCRCAAGVLYGTFASLQRNRWFCIFFPLVSLGRPLGDSWGYLWEALGGHGVSLGTLCCPLSSLWASLQALWCPWMPL